jgi:hypothetical protein
MTNQEQVQVRNQTIDELCDWITSCLTHVDPNSETHKACTAMVNGMRTQKLPEPQQDTRYPDEQHYPIHGVQK